MWRWKRFGNECGNTSALMSTRKVVIGWLVGLGIGRGEGERELEPATFTEGSERLRGRLSVGLHARIDAKIDGNLLNL